jgi:hypothetical protein
MLRDRAAKLKAEREIAEIHSEQLKSTLVLRSEVKAVWDDGFLKIVDCVKRCTELSGEARVRLVNRMREAVAGE